MALVPCDECRRHVRAGEAACPFCKTVRNVTTVAVVAASALAIAGCDTFSPASKYGGPPGYVYTPPDAEAPVSTSPRVEPAPAPSPSASNSEPPRPAALYGAPPR